MEVFYMNYEKTIAEFSPCGKDCSRCVSYKDGEVVRLSTALKAALTNFEHKAKQQRDFNPLFNSYSDFITLLDYFSNGQCEGCRYTATPSPGCSIRACHKEQQVNFCAECKQFPCSPQMYTPRLIEEWLSNNKRIQENGISSFYEEEKAKPRY